MAQPQSFQPQQSAPQPSIAGLLEQLVNVATVIAKPKPGLARVLSSPEPGSGRIELVLGPMFSGKSTELIQRVRTEALANRRCLVVQYERDQRFGASADTPAIRTHAEQQLRSAPDSEYSAQIRVVSAMELIDVAPEDDEYVVGVDEGQFFGDLVEVCLAWAAQGRRVIVAALDGNYKRQPFGRVCDLVPHCELVEKKSGVCMACRKRPAAFTRRRSSAASAAPAVSADGTAPIEIGGRELYEAVCRACHPT